MNKSIYDEALDNTQTLLGLIILYEKNAKKKLDMLNQIEQALEQSKKQEQLLELYKEFFDKLNIQLRNTFDIDYIYPHEFIIGYDIKSEDKELVKLFKQIKELEEEEE